LPIKQAYSAPLPWRAPPEETGTELVARGLQLCFQFFELVRPGKRILAGLASGNDRLGPYQPTTDWALSGGVVRGTFTRLGFGVMGKGGYPTKRRAPGALPRTHGLDRYRAEAAAAAARDGWKDDIILALTEEAAALKVQVAALTAELAARTAELVVRKRRRTSS
jgi:hypothetical protein